MPTSFFKIPAGLKFSILQFLKRRPFFFIKIMLIFILFLGDFLMERERAKAKLSLRVALAVVHPIERRVKKDFDSGKEILNKFKRESKNYEVDSHDPVVLLQRMNHTNQVANIFFKPDFPIYLSKEVLVKAAQKLWELDYPGLNFIEAISHLPKNASLRQLSDSEEQRFSRTSWDVYFATIPEQKSETASPHKVLSPKLNSVWQARIQTIMQWMEWDEELHHDTGVFIETSRKVLLNTARYLVSHQVLEVPELIFFLQLNEVKTALKNPLPNLTARARFRKRRFELRKQQTPEPLLPPLKSSEMREHTLKDAWTGEGRAKGEARAVFHFMGPESSWDDLPRERFILVTRTPNPAWIPLFPKLAGWITESGGQLAHGFVAARDYGLPAISEFHLETLTALGPGTSLQMNGASGRVNIIS